MGLVYFKGGPLDGRAYETQSLMTHEALRLEGLSQYKWTPEKITSKQTGAEARVWVWPQEQEYVPAQPPAAEPEEQTQMSATELTERRKALHVTRASLAEKAGISIARLDKIERGTNTDEALVAKVTGLLAELEASGGSTNGDAKPRAKKRKAAASGATESEEEGAQGGRAGESRGEWQRTSEWNGIKKGDVVVVEGTCKPKKRKPVWTFVCHTVNPQGVETIEVHGGLPGHEQMRSFEPARVSLPSTTTRRRRTA